MNTTNATICLNMIVRNEAHVITRCLDSVMEYIDFWVISDTGSTDSTQAIIVDYFSQHDIPGLLMAHPWIDFATNRNLALDAAAGRADYVLIMDADDVLVLPDGWGELMADCYSLQLHLGETRYAVPKLIRESLPWRWEGVVHEHLACGVDFTSAQHGGVILASTEGARGRDPDKYIKDAQVLELALRDDPSNARHQFYLAQSYRDAGTESGKLLALRHYQQRAVMGGFQEEVYCAMLEVANLMRDLSHPLPSVLNAYMAADNYRPQRMEAAYHAVRLCREAGFYQLGWALGSTKMTKELPDDVLFIDASVYYWRFNDELSICAVYSGHKECATRLMAELLESRSTPDAERGRISTNLAFAKQN